MAEPSKERFCERSLTEILGLNPAGVMDIYIFYMHVC
jgi:hypothetical protein